MRSNALELVEFTVKQIQQLTQLNPASIRTELSRLKKGGYLISEPVKEKRIGRGAPAHIYRLTDDKDKIKELINEVEKFYWASNQEGHEPTGLNYRAALSLLDQIENSDYPEAERRAMLKRVEYHLELAIDDEGIDHWHNEETRLAEAYLSLAKARVAMAIEEKGEAEELISMAQEVFDEYQIEEGSNRAATLANTFLVEKILANNSQVIPMVGELLEEFEGQHGQVSVHAVQRVLALVFNTIARNPQSSLTRAPQSNLEDPNLSNNPFWTSPQLKDAIEIQIEPNYKSLHSIRFDLQDSIEEPQVIKSFFVYSGGETRLLQLRVRARLPGTVIHGDLFDENPDGPYYAGREVILYGGAWKSDHFYLQIDEEGRVVEGILHGVDPAEVNLTEPQETILSLASRGITYREIGEQLSISASTVQRHMTEVCQKVGVRNRRQATLWYISHQER